MATSAPEMSKLVWCCSKCGAIYHKDFPRCPADGAEIVQSDRDPLPGTQIAHYVIGSLIGEGGMGRVYRAHHAQLAHKSYAIKVLLGDIAATASMRKRFANEATLASRIEHPNLVGVIDFGETANGLPYIVMELVEGDVLSEVAGRGPMSPKRVVKLALGICDGLAYAHEAGLVHRDLKPDNVILASVHGVEVPRLTDFGLALDAELGAHRLTTTGMVMGTPAYAAPEQMSGKTLDARVDLYALGMTMFEMLTGGELPFDGSPPEISSAKAHREAPLISEKMPGIAVPQDLQVIVSRLLRRRREERYPNARAVAAELARVRFHGEGALAPVLTQRTQRHWRPWFWVGAATVAAFAVASIIGWKYLRKDSPRAEASPVPVHVPMPDPAPPSPAPPSPPPTTQVAEVAEVVEVPTPPPPKSPRPRARPHRKDPVTTTTAVRAHRDTRPAAPPSLGALATPTPPPDPVPVAVPVPAAPTAKPTPGIASVAVHGALAVAEVRRAVDRVVPALDRCAPAQPGKVTVELSIGESRKAENVRAAGVGGTTDSCVASVFSAIRTESAPDVGDANVTVQVAFVVK